MRRIEAEREGLTFLVYRDGNGEQQIFPLREQVTRVVIGRDESAELRLDWDDQVSGLHAELERIGRQWTVVDDGLSRNGTFLNGERLGGRRRLGDGDALRFGSTVAILRAPPEEMRTRTVAGEELPSVQLTEMQRRVLVALCRP